MNCICLNTQTFYGGKYKCTVFATHSTVFDNVYCRVVIPMYQLSNVFHTNLQWVPTPTLMGKYLLLLQVNAIK
jgi:hypothetical protein